MAEFEDIPDLPVPDSDRRGRADSSPPRRERPVTFKELGRRKRLAVVVGCVWLGAQLATFGVRDDLMQIDRGYFLGLFLLPLLGGLASILLAVRPGELGLGSHPSWVRSFTLGLPALYLMVAGLTPTVGAAMRGTNSFPEMCCFDSLAMWAVLPVIAGAVALRQTFAANAAWRCALFGAGCALTAGAFYSLHCPGVGPWHFVTKHGGAVIFSTAVTGVCLPYVTRIG